MSPTTDSLVSHDSRRTPRHTAAHPTPTHTTTPPPPHQPQRSDEHPVWTSATDVVSYRGGTAAQGDSAATAGERVRAAPSRHNTANWCASRDQKGSTIAGPETLRRDAGKMAGSASHASTWFAGKLGRPEAASCVACLNGYLLSA